MPRLRSCTGQAAAEYVAVLAVVAVALGGAAVAAPRIGERVVAAVRTGLCIVGGDICRAADAAAAGLAPCLTSERYRRQDTTLDIAVVRLGGRGEWQLALQSDGGATVTRLADGRAGATAGIGVTFSPLGVDAGASGALTFGYRSGTTWRFPDARTARAFLAAAERDGDVQASRPPSVSWHALTGDAGAEAAVAVRELAKAGLRIGAGAALGVRTEGARRTLALEAASAGPSVFADLQGFPSAPAGGGTVAEISWLDGALDELVLRTARAGGDRVEEYSARLALDDPASRAAAATFLVPGGEPGADLPALLARDGVLDRAVYAVDERRRGLSVAGRIGVALGFEHQRITGERRLVEATTIVRGGPPQRRVDCLRGSPEVAA